MVLLLCAADYECQKLSRRMIMVVFNKGSSKRDTIKDKRNNKKRNIVSRSTFELVTAQSTQSRNETFDCREITVGLELISITILGRTSQIERQQQTTKLRWLLPHYIICSTPNPGRVSFTPTKKHTTQAANHV